MTCVQVRGGVPGVTVHGKNCRAPAIFAASPSIPALPPAKSPQIRSQTQPEPLVRSLHTLRVMDIRNYLFGGLTRQTVYKSLDASALRGRVIAENLANVDTPGYQRKEVLFEDQLKKALEKKLPGEITQPSHMEFGKGVDLSKVVPQVFTPLDPTLPGELNNVDIDIEAAKMAENQILFNYAIKFAGFDKMNSAILGHGSAG